MDRPQHTRSKSGISFMSNKSNKSDKSNESKRLKPQVKDLHESEAGKRRSKFAGISKTNPNQAISEAQPATRALEAYTLLPIRSMQHKDAFGNVITDPDASNPARNRMERPLDTIRAFEAAIDNSYKQRTVSVRGDTSDAPTGYSSRRSSFVGGNDAPMTPRYSPAGGINNGSRLSSLRQGGYDNSYANFGSPRRPHGQRIVSAPGPSRLSYEHNVYPGHGYQESHDTVHTGGSSGSASEPWANSTDPSSENSSIDRLQAPKQMENGDAYGNVYPAVNGNGYGNAYGNGYSNGYGNGHYNGYGNGNGYNNGSPIRGPIMEENWQDDNGYYQQNYDGRRPSFGDHQRIYNEPQQTYNGVQPYYNDRQQIHHERPFAQPNPNRNGSTGERPPLPISHSQPLPQTQPQRNVIQLSGNHETATENIQNKPSKADQTPVVAQSARASAYLKKPQASKPLPAAPKKQPEKEKRKSWLKRTFSKG